MIDREKFYSNIRKMLFHSLTQSQVDGINAILREWEQNYSDNSIANLAYMLATVYHETARTMQPIEEYGKGKGHDYGDKFKMTRKPYTTPDKLYYGRGFVQLTWYENYAKASKKLGVDLLNNPELALNLEIATKILFLGMFEGWFTTRKLSDYISTGKLNFVGARAIINGKDKASTIASYASIFLAALR
jgi:hypothetical protein